MFPLVVVNDVRPIKLYSILFLLCKIYTNASMNIA